MKVVHVKFMPKKKEPDTIYISKDYGVSIHLCACGCGTEAVLPFNQKGVKEKWKLTEREGKVTFKPSILNTGKCKSHYFIRNNKVVWIGKQNA